MIKCSQGGLHDLTTTSPYMMLYTGKYIRITQHLSQFHIPCFYYAHIPIVSNYTLKPPRPFPVHFHGIQPDSFPKNIHFPQKKYWKKLEPPKRRQVNSTPCAVFWKITTWNVPTLPGERQ
jgi:hypothetical protein